MKTETEKQSALGGACMAPPAQTEDELPPFQGLPASLCKKRKQASVPDNFKKSLVVWRKQTRAAPDRQTVLEKRGDGGTNGNDKKSTARCFTKT